jgi:ABC-2 type transport system ATP-binding protein
MNENQTPLAVDAAGLRKSFGAVRAVDGVDLRVRPGEIVAFLGPTAPARRPRSTCCWDSPIPTRARCASSARARAAIAHGLVSAVLQTGVS